MEKNINSEYIEREAEKHRKLSEAIRTVIEYVNPNTVSNFHTSEVVGELRNELERTEIDVLEHVFGKNMSRLVNLYEMEREKLPF